MLAVAFAVHLLPGLLPGGTVTGLLGPRALDPVARESLAGELRTGWPLPTRSGAWILQSATGDLGRSGIDGADVGALVARASARTLPVVLVALLVAVLVARRQRVTLDATTAGLVALALLAGERLAGSAGLGGLLSDAVARRDLMVMWGAVLAVAVGAALLTAVSGLRPLRSALAQSPAPPPPWASWAAGGWIVLFPALAAFAPRLPIEDPHRIDPGRAREWFGATHLLGTDDLGRDVLARTVFGARVSLGLAVTAVLLALVVGAVCGAVAELVAVRLHGPVRSWVAMLVSFPGPLLALALASFGGREARTMVLWLAASAMVPVVIFTRSAVRAVTRDRLVGDGPISADLVRRLGHATAALAARLLAVVVLVEAGLGLLRLAPDVRLAWSVDLAGEMSRARPAWPVVIATGAVALVTAASLAVLSRTATASGVTLSAAPRRAVRPTGALG